MRSSRNSWRTWDWPSNRRRRWTAHRCRRQEAFQMKKKKWEPRSYFSFYRQQRADRGIRTGLAYMDMSALEHFEPGQLNDENPALRWSIDIDLENVSLPEPTPEAARQW